MMYLVIHLMLGPFILLIGYLFKRFPPRKINSWYGYRTPRSMRSQQAWDEGNRYSANAFMVVALLTCLFQVIAYSLLSPHTAITYSAFGMAAALVGIIPVTELHLRNKGFR